jgi:hypothetical protein
MDPTYLTTPTTAFGPAEWVFFGASILVALAGVYYAFLHHDQSMPRGTALRQLGYGLLVTGAIGVLIGAVRLAGIALAPFWFTIATVLYVLLAVYALYYATTVYPRQRAAAQAANRGRGGGGRPSPARPATANRAVGSDGARLSPTAPGATATGVQRAIGTGTRRDSRRDRKRRNK